ncbi:MAG: aspartate-semialdehyde dehydrogenase [Bacteroidota bacterium]
MIRVGILGATGAVGQRFVQLLDGHPYFRVTALAASERSAGKPYAEAAHWTLDTPIPKIVRDLVVQPCTPELDCDFVFSGLDSSVAGEVEAAFARAGYPVISNAKNYRMHPDVPLLIPEVNPDHTALIDRQQWGNEATTGGLRDDGYIVTNPNCSAVGLVCALKPLHDAFGIEALHVVTMQALSGAGYPGVASLDAVANVVPYIGGEEPKLSEEPGKLLGTLTESGIEHVEIRTSATCTRVPVVDGHMEAVSVQFRSRASAADAVAALRAFVSPIDHMALPSSPDRLLHVFDEDAYPQPRRHVHREGGMQVTIGRVRDCELFDVKFVVLSHNTIRGAAGGAVLNAELLRAQQRLGIPSDRVPVL